MLEIRPLDRVRLDDGRIVIATDVAEAPETLFCFEADGGETGVTDRAFVVDVLEEAGDESLSA